MALHPAEEATLRSFVIAAKRDRMIALLGNPKRRRQTLNALNHFTDWDSRFARAVAASADVLALLREAGAPRDCHVISDDENLDGRDMPLADAVSAADSFCFASVLCCVPGRLAFYFDEVAAPRNRLLLCRDSVAW